MQLYFGKKSALNSNTLVPQACTEYWKKKYRPLEVMIIFQREKEAISSFDDISWLLKHTTRDRKALADVVK